jgi:predicted nuclease of restriction endonuclease-like (RecB) superfamily
LNFPPPPYHPRWFSSQIRRQAEWPDQRIAVQQKAGSAEKPHERTERQTRKPAQRFSPRRLTTATYWPVWSSCWIQRGASARVVNTLMTATYWEIGRRIVEHEQAGQKRAGYGEEVVSKFSKDLTQRFGRGFGPAQVAAMRQFHLTFPLPDNFQSVIGKSEILQSVIGISSAGAVERLSPVARALPLPWTHYVRLLRVRNSHAREFYAREALAGGWSVRQLDRQINSQFYERTALSKDKTAMLLKGEIPKPEDAVSADEEIRNPLLLEFLNLKDEYSESELEDALIGHLETFLLELGNEFAFVGRQKRLRVGHEWFRVDLVFFHRRLRCLLIIDLKIGELVHADIGQMHLYTNFAREHWMQSGENPPVGLILCTGKNDALAHYAMEGLGCKMLVREYRTALPKEWLRSADGGGKVERRAERSV